MANERNPHGIKVGQELYFVFNDARRGDPVIVTVTSVGTKWASLEGHAKDFRIDIRTLIADGRGYSSPGTAFISKEQYEDKLETMRVWGDFCNTVGAHRYALPKGMTREKIRQARKTLEL